MSFDRLRNPIVLAVSLLIGSTPASAADFNSLYTAGHADFAAGYDSTNGLHLFFELSSTARVDGSLIGGSGASADPSSISVVVPESVLATGHANLPSPYGGSPLYLLSSTSAGATSRPFLGFGAEEIDAGLFDGDLVSLGLTGFSSTSGGEFVLYTNGSQSSPAMSTADGISAFDSIDLFAGGHDHYNLGFTEAGVYDLTFTVSGALVGGGLETANAVVRFVVGEVQAPAVPEPGSLAMAGAATVAMTVALRRSVRRRRF